MTKLPDRLDNTPLVDALFELRFSPRVPSAADLLLGLLYEDLESPEDADIGQLPAANVPRPIRERDANLRYQAIHRLTAAGRRYLIGDRTLAVAFGTEYPGWSGFEPVVHDAVRKIEEAKITLELERFSFRYINLLEAPEGNRLEKLNGEFRLLGGPCPENGFQLRTEQRKDDLLAIIQIHAGATARRPDGPERSGLLLDLDVIRLTNSDEFWRNYSDLLSAAHQRIKELFFALITEQTLTELGPHYGES